jgi:MFS transporter, PCFT/HCP family, solute carrier family 46, member 3
VNVKKVLETKAQIFTFRWIGFYGVFSISAVLYLLAFCYGLFFIKEVEIKKDDEKARLKASEKGLLADFFDYEHVVETFRVAFKKGCNQRQMRVIMLMIVVMVVIGPMYGESVVYKNLCNLHTWSDCGDLSIEIFCSIS